MNYRRAERLTRVATCLVPTPARVHRIDITDDDRELVVLRVYRKRTPAPSRKPEAGLGDCSALGDKALAPLGVSQRLPFGTDREGNPEGLAR